MPRGKLRTVVDVCADCGAHDPTWASINRGILVCDECCSVHRSLGRQVSQVKSLKKDTWSSSQLLMVHTLYTNGANNIWEHSLLDPTHVKSGRRKPSSKDPVNPTKADFVRAKHQMLAFVHRPNRSDGQTPDGDISKQLHSSVRTANLETCLRLLSLGADPNYFHPEKGTCPVHVAAKAGQILQMELLAVYGADPGAYDSEGNTPLGYAEEAGHEGLVVRLTELQYELTDRLAYYVCNRKPDHALGQHFIIPEMADSLDLSEFSKVAKRKLQLLSNHLFEELTMDVYDEVDRRHTDDIWLSCQNYSTLVTDRCTLPFLPVNTEYSSTRNQGRQKLARFNAREFTTLIIDILCDVRRRQLGLTLSGAPKNDRQIPVTVGNRSTNTALRSASEETCHSDEEPLYDSVASDDETVQDHRLAFARSLARCPRELPATSRTSYGLPNGFDVQSSPNSSGQVCVRSQRLSQRPQSMYEPREQQRQQVGEGRFTTGATQRSKDDAHPCMSSTRRSSDSDNRDVHCLNDGFETMTSTGRRFGGSVLCSASNDTPAVLPSQSDALSKTRNITQRIQELHFLAREGKHKSYITCAERIHVAILELVAIFPEDPVDENVKQALSEVIGSDLRLQTESKLLLTPRQDQSLDCGYVAKQIIQRAFDTTKAIKALITLLE